MRKSWTDERLDDFAAHTDRRFDAVDRRFDEVDRRFDEVDRRFDRVESELGRINDRLHGLQRVLLQSHVVMIAGLLGLIATQL